MSRRVEIRGALRAASLLFLAQAALPASSAAQMPIDLSGGDLVWEERIQDREISTGVPLVPGVDRYIVVHLAENRVFLFEGDEAVWSSPSGTGTGTQLDTGERAWKFTTPRGLFKVKRMERDPIWLAPDWHFIEKGLRVPPPDHPSRRIANGMGNTALYLGDGIAIHGTDKPELLLNPDPDARRVSHGCIRLTNEAARELMHLVEVGTPVLIF